VRGCAVRPAGPVTSPCRGPACAGPAPARCTAPADDTLVLRVKPDNVKLQVARSAVSSLVTEKK